MDKRDWKQIYRRVKSKPVFMKDGRPSSALFKDSHGVSVDKDMGRTEKDIISDEERLHRFYNQKLSEEEIRQNGEELKLLQFKAVLCVNPHLQVTFKCQVCIRSGCAGISLSEMLSRPVRLLSEGTERKTESERNGWYIHHAKKGGGQILICTAGEGWYQEEGKEAVSLVPGMVITIPATADFM